MFQHHDLRVLYVYKVIAVSSTVKHHASEFLSLKLIIPV